MKQAFVLLREFSYGYDFTEFGENGRIIVHASRHGAEAEIADEYIEYLTQVIENNRSLEDVCFDLIVCICDYDDEKVIAYGENNDIIVESQRIHESQQ